MIGQRFFKKVICENIDEITLSQHQSRGGEGGIEIDRKSTFPCCVNLTKAMTVEWDDLVSRGTWYLYCTNSLFEAVKF